MSTHIVPDFEVVDHGIEHSQYFHGCGTAFTKFEHVATGCGNDFAEAMEDALESIAQQHSDIDFPAFEQAIKAEIGCKTVSWPESDAVPEDAEDCYYYVSIRYSLPGRIACDQCSAASINGVFCHETGCPNSRKTWDPERGQWIKYVTCFECGCEVEQGEVCDCQNTEAAQ